MEPESDCLVRYGLSGRVGWFALDADLRARVERGRTVVIRSGRGTELGEVLVVAAASDGSVRRRAAEDSIGRFRVVRPAGDEDFALGRQADLLRAARFDDCRRIVDESGWPMELIDVEPLLDLTTVLHYFGGDGLDLGPIRARFRAVCDFDVEFEDLAAAPAEDAESAPQPASRAEGCGSGGCGSGGCGSGGCSTRTDSGRSGCSGCGVAALLKNRRAAPTALS